MATRWLAATLAIGHSLAVLLWLEGESMFWLRGGAKLEHEKEIDRATSAINTGLTTDISYLVL